MKLNFNKQSLLIHTNLFLIFWLLIGSSISLHDIDKYTLQQAGADAWVSYGNPRLGQSSLSIFRPTGDFFNFEGGLYPAKQPGQFVISAIPYALIKAVGISYESNYRLAATLVTFFSASLISALALIMIFCGLKSQFNCHWKPALIAVLSLGFGSQWLPYSGIAHHDIMASSCLIAAFFIAKLGAPYGTPQPGKTRLILSALLIGLCFFISMLPAFVAGALGLIFLLRWKLKGLPFLALGFLIGLSPLLLYNYIYFGNPILQANVAGNFNDTFLYLNIKNFLHHVNAYFGFYGMSQWVYAPLLMLGGITLWQLPKAFNYLKWLAATGFGLHIFYITNIQTLGTCSYGPRYLLPLLPFACIGLALFLNSLKNSAKPSSPAIVFVKNVVLVLLAWGGLSAVTGALFGTINCRLNKVQMVSLLQSNKPLSTEHLPLLQHYGVLLISMLTISALLILAALYHRRLLNFFTQLQERISGKTAEAKAKN
ncbi:hypothetical protein SAMN02745866_01461 [Alteromonadaceae bacterium Bs31]|nr:hypothetical protein SAMN02745866_01461 [Alteromonadaceae bacterium Bs31]